MKMPCIGCKLHILWLCPFWRAHRNTVRDMTWRAGMKRMLNQTGATCPCAESLAVWCTECEGNRR